MGNVPYLLYIDDLKIFSAPLGKLERVMKVTKRATEDIGLVCNKKKCCVAHVKHGSLSSDQGDTVIGDAQVIKALKEGES